MTVTFFFSFAVDWPVPLLWGWCTVRLHVFQPVGTAQWAVTYNVAQLLRPVVIETVGILLISCSFLPCPRGPLGFTGQCTSTTPSAGQSTFLAEHFLLPQLQQLNFDIGC